MLKKEGKKQRKLERKGEKGIERERKKREGVDRKDVRLQTPLYVANTNKNTIFNHVQCLYFSFLTV